MSRVPFGRSRVESDRWVALGSHYGSTRSTASLGHEVRYEKGGVEGEGGWLRRAHSVPMPVVGSMDELNALIQAWDDADDRRRIGSRASRVGYDWASNGRCCGRCRLAHARTEGEIASQGMLR